MTRKSISDSVRQRLWKERPHVCAVCGLPIHDIKDCHIDHKIPVSKGGTNSRLNLQLTHAFCNLSKGAKVPFKTAAAVQLDVIRHFPDLPKSKDQWYAIELARTCHEYLKDLFTNCYVLPMSWFIHQNSNYKVHGLEADAIKKRSIQSGEVTVWQDKTFHDLLVIRGGFLSENYRHISCAEIFRGGVA